MLQVDTHESLLERINTKEAKVAVIGQGYVGLPRSVAFAQVGFITYAIDVNKERLQQLKSGENYITPEDKTLASVVQDELLIPTDDFNCLNDVDAIVICVPTPLNKHREPDLKYVTRASESIAQHLRPRQLVVLESTTFPGTTEEVVQKILEKGGLVAGKDFFLAFSPERVDPGNKDFNTFNTPKIVGGLDARSTDLAKALYSSVVERVLVASTPKVAEMAKLLENIFRCVNVALVNELSLLCRRMEIDVWEVIELASSKPYGFMPFYPGPGIGGHCIPIDPYYLTWKAREYDFNTRFVELAGEVNTNQPYEIVNLITEALGTHGKPLVGSKVLVLGAAYKPDVADCRESPAVRIIEILRKRGAEVFYNDPHVPDLEEMHIQMSSVPLKDLFQYDCVVIATDHSDYDFQKIVQEAQLVVDSRNGTRNHRAPHVHVL